MVSEYVGGQARGVGGGDCEVEGAVITGNTV